MALTRGRGPRSEPSGQPVSPTTSSCDRASCRRPWNLPGACRMSGSSSITSPSRRSRPVPWNRGAPGSGRSGAGARCLQGVRARHRSRLVVMDAGRPAALRGSRDRRLRAGAADLRVRLAGLPAGCDLRGRRRRGAGRPGWPRRGRAGRGDECERHPDLRPCSSRRTAAAWPVHSPWSGSESRSASR